MTLEEAYILINNLDVREPLRKYAPQWSSVLVDKSGKILDVIRRKERPTQAMYCNDLDSHPHSVQFTAKPGMYPTVEKLAKKIEDCKWAHENY